MFDVRKNDIRCKETLYICHIASSMFSFKRYPTREEFIRIALEIINKYPFMKTTTGSPSGAIVQSLINRFKEFRRIKTVRNPTTSKPSHSHTSNMKPSTSLLKPLEAPAGEDDISFQRHNNQIRAELSKKGKINRSIVDNLVKQTFSMRRKDITENPCHSFEVLKKYSFLKEVDQLFLEMEMICGSEQIRNTVRSSWNGLWSLKVLEQAKLEKNNNARLRGVMTDLCVEPEQYSKFILLPEYVVVITSIIHRSCYSFLVPTTLHDT
jgi:hypothetical protein